MQGPEPAAPALSSLRRSDSSQDRRRASLAPRRPLSGETLLPVPGPGANTPSIRQEVEQWRCKVATDPVPSASYLLRNGGHALHRTAAEFVSEAADVILCSATYNSRLLKIDRMPAASLPPALGRLAQLQTLWIKDTECAALPDSICELARLRCLWLAANPQLTRLPDDIGKLQQLESLSVADTPLQSLPDSIGALSRLSELRLSGGKYEQLPSSLSSMAALKELCLGSHAHLQALPAGLGRLAKLEQLEIKDCPELKSLPPLGGLRALKRLELRDCPKLETLPSDLGALSHLRSLHLIGCRALTDLPESLSRLPAHCDIRVPHHLAERLAELRPSQDGRPRRGGSPAAATSLPQAAGTPG
ncbi:MAG TPA: leucine-rich repeat domain-containing protein [Burkholderiaceae bacterium]|nr:leucine-rich repeat domain-containing protein [Burkholderiaceae bacterium]